MAFCSPSESVVAEINARSPMSNSKSQWEGVFDESGASPYPMILNIEKVNGQFFNGQLNWPSIQNIVTRVDGEILNTNNIDFTTKSKLRQLEDVIENEGGIFLHFRESVGSSNEKGLIADGEYFAYIYKNSKTMKGIWIEAGKFTNKGQFIISTE